MLVALEAEAAALGRVGAAPARELAACVADWWPQSSAADGAPAEDLGAATAATVGEETYFRDRGSESFVAEVLDEPTAARRRSLRAWLAAAAIAVIAVAGGALAVRRALRSGHPRAATVAATIPPTPARPAAPPPSPHAPAATPPSPHAPAATPPPAAARRPAAAHKAAGTGTLLVHCTPWCIPSVDDQVRGSDGRNHYLVLPAGTHRISVRRLDDHSERTVDVRAGESQTLEFTFD